MPGAVEVEGERVIVARSYPSGQLLCMNSPPALESADGSSRFMTSPPAPALDSVNDIGRGGPPPTKQHNDNQLGLEQAAIDESLQVHE